MTNLAQFGDWFENITGPAEAEYGVIIDDTVGGGLVLVLMDDGEILLMDPDHMSSIDPESVSIDDPEAHDRLIKHISEYTEGGE